jgi:hypothetical protein
MEVIHSESRMQLVLSFVCWNGMHVLCNTLTEITMNRQVQDEWDEECGSYHLYFQRMISEICSSRIYDVFLTGVSNALVRAV